MYHHLLKHRKSTYFKDLSPLTIDTAHFVPPPTEEYEIIEGAGKRLNLRLTSSSQIQLHQTLPTFQARFLLAFRPIQVQPFPLSAFSPFRLTGKRSRRYDIGKCNISGVFREDFKVLLVLISSRDHLLTQTTFFLSPSFSFDRTFHSLI